MCGPGRPVRVPRGPALFHGHDDTEARRVPCNVPFIPSQHEILFSQSLGVTNTHNPGLAPFEEDQEGTSSFLLQWTAALPLVAGAGDTPVLPTVQLPALKQRATGRAGEVLFTSLSSFSSKVIFFKQSSLLLLLSCGSPEDYTFLSIKASA